MEGIWRGTAARAIMGVLYLLVGVGVPLGMGEDDIRRVGDGVIVMLGEGETMALGTAEGAALWNGSPLLACGAADACGCARCCMAIRLLGSLLTRDWSDLTTCVAAGVRLANTIDTNTALLLLRGGLGHKHALLARRQPSVKLNDVA
jgi:hypothetical protein